MKHIIKQDQTATWNIDESGDKWELAKGTSITTNFTPAIYEDNTRSNNHIVIAGKLDAVNPIMTSDAYGLQSYGTKTDIDIEASGRLGGDNGVNMQGSKQSLVNDGKIDVKDEGVTSAGAGNEIVNNGLIEGYAAVVGSSSGLTLVNHGQLKGDQSAVYFYADATLALKNDGLIKGGTTAILDYVGDADIVNKGKIVGNVSLGEGDDRFDNRGGKVDGEVSGGLGSDIYILDNASLDIDELLMGGFDTVKSTVDYKLSTNLEHLTLIGGKDTDGTGNASANKLIGNAGDNKLFALEGQDRLMGGEGNDRLSGGADADTFVFKKGDGHDVITDFDAQMDRIDLSGMNEIKSFGDLKNHHIEQAGDDLVITAGNDQIVLRDTVKSDLNDMQFDF